MTTRKLRITPLALLGLGMALMPMAANAQNETPKPIEPMKMRPEMRLSAMDKKFMMDAARGGIAEVQLGQLAAKRGAKASVKKFGQHMVQDHSAANEELKAIAESKSVTLPTDVGAKHKTHIVRLSKLSGAAFDSAYIKHMVMDHEKDVADFTKASKMCSDPDVKGFAEKTLPTLKEHYQMITALRNGKSKMASTKMKM